MYRVENEPRPAAPTIHQYVRRGDGRVVTETLLGDWILNFLYSRAREQSGPLYRALSSAWTSKMLAFVNFDLPLAPRLIGHRRFLRSCGVDLDECLDPIESFDTPRKIFERKIRYWECRPMPAAAVVSPADARAVVGSLEAGNPLFLKDKFFDLRELLGANKPRWLEAFGTGAFSVLRLTPDQYHYNHTPVAGEVVDFYEIPGLYHACNPGALVDLVTPLSKNKRVVTVVQTDVAGGSGVGLVAMIEVVALMIGDIEQCYSARRYDDPQPLRPGMKIEQGLPKSRFRPGSSTDVLLFEGRRIRFCTDLVRNLSRPEAQSRYTLGFGQPLVETDVRARSPLAIRAIPGGGAQ